MTECVSEIEGEAVQDCHVGLEILMQRQEGGLEVEEMKILR